MSQIAAMLNAHYAGEINIVNYWSVGDTRIETLEEIPAGTLSKDEPYQTITLTIIDFNHDILETPINNKTRAAITVLTSPLKTLNYLGSGQSLENIIIQSENDIRNMMWKKWDRRTWCNTDFYNTLPTQMKNSIKTVIKYSQTYTLINIYDTSDTITNTAGTYIVEVDTSSDKVFLLSAPEIARSTMSNKEYTFPSESNPSTEYQFELLTNNDKNIFYYTREFYVSSMTRSATSPTGIYYNGTFITSTHKSTTTGGGSGDYSMELAFCL